MKQFNNDPELYAIRADSLNKVKDLLVNISECVNLPLRIAGDIEVSITLLSEAESNRIYP
jgi:hypothetical protein